MSNVVPFPSISNSACQGHSMPGLTTEELRQRALDNFYTAERRKGADAVTAYERMVEFGQDLDRTASQMEQRR